MQPVLSSTPTATASDSRRLKRTSRPAPSFLPIAFREALRLNMLCISRQQDLDLVMEGGSTHQRKIYRGSPSVSRRVQGARE